MTIKNYETKLLLLDKYKDEVSALDLSAFCSETELTNFVGGNVFAINLKGEFVLVGEATAIAVTEVNTEEIQDQIVLTVETFDGEVVLDESTLYTDDFDFEFGYDAAGVAQEFNIFVLEHAIELTSIIDNVEPVLPEPTIDVALITASYEDNFAEPQAQLEVTQEINLLNAVDGSTYTWSVTDVGATGDEVNFIIDPTVGTTVTFKAIVTENNTIADSVTINVTDGVEFSQDFVIELAINNSL